MYVIVGGGCFSLISVALTKCHEPKQPGEESVYFTLWVMSLHEWKSGRKLQAET